MVKERLTDVFNGNRVEKQSQTLLIREQKLCNVIGSVGNCALSARAFGKTVLHGVNRALFNVLINFPTPQSFHGFQRVIGEQDRSIRFGNIICCLPWRGEEDDLGSSPSPWCVGKHNTGLVNERKERDSIIRKVLENHRFHAIYPCCLVRFETFKSFPDSESLIHSSYCSFTSSRSILQLLLWRTRVTPGTAAGKCVAVSKEMVSTPSSVRDPSSFTSTLIDRLCKFKEHSHDSFVRSLLNKLPPGLLLSFIA